MTEQDRIAAILDACQEKQVVSMEPQQFPKYQSSRYQLLSRTSRSSGSKYVIACALFASLNSVLLGYDIGIMSGAVLFIKEDLGIHELQEAVLMSSLNLVSLFGGMLAGRLADAVGRKLTMAVASLVFLIGAAAMGVAPTFAVLLLGRVISGIGVGFGLIIAPVYTAELAPSGSRGALVSFPEVFINVGILLGYVMSYLLSGLRAAINWRLMLGAGCIPALVLACGVMFMPESPRWLVMQNRIDEAKQVLLKASSDSIEADRRLADIIAAAGGGESDVVSGVKKSQGEGVWHELLCPVASVRRMLVVVLGVQFFQQASGIDALIYYSPAVFNEAGVKSKTGLLATTVAIGFAKTLSVLVATRFLDKIGRRPLLLASSIGMTVSLGAVAMGFVFFDIKTTSKTLPVQSLGENSSQVAVASTLGAISLFMVFFSIGFGPVCWVLTSEVFPLRLRAQAVSLAVVVSRLVSGTVTFTFLGLSEIITSAGAFFVFCTIAAASVVFVYVFVPETKGKTLEEVSMLFEDKNEQVFAGNVELGEARPFPDEDFVDEDAELPAYDHASLLAKVKQIAKR